ncbi:hypothetical protein TNCV_2773371 [Trichonephila clavipes]|nr:hypothetical protein TNCV_2773371 [Trichonephila clavipes]
MEAKHVNEFRPNDVMWEKTSQRPVEKSRQTAQKYRHENGLHLQQPIFAKDFTFFACERSFRGSHSGDFRKMKKFNQTPYKLPPPTPIHVPAEKRPLEERLYKKRVRPRHETFPDVQNLCRFRCPRTCEDSRFQMSQNLCRFQIQNLPVQISDVLEPVQIPVIPEPPVQIPEVPEPVPDSVSARPQPPMQILQNL